MQDYNTIIGAIQMRQNKCQTRSVMDRFRIGSSTLNLIMSRYKALELTIDELEAMSPKDVNSHNFTGCNIRQKSRLVANPVDVHLFTRLAIYRH